MQQKAKKILYKLRTIFSVHQAFVILAVLLIVAGLVIFRLSELSGVEPSPEYIEDQTRSIQPVIFNEEAIEEIKALRDSNVRNPGTDIQQDRNNPFAE